MIVPPLDVHSHKRRTSIFQKKRYSPQKILQKSRRLEKVPQLRSFHHEQRAYRHKVNVSQRQYIPAIREIPVFIPQIQPIRRLSPPLLEHRMHSFIPQIIPLEQRILPPIPPPLHMPIPITPLIHPAPHLLHPIDPILIGPDVSSFSGSPIIRQAPSTYFQISQRILGGTLPRYPPVPSILYLDRSFSGRKIRQSPVKDIHISNQNHSHNNNKAPGQLNKNVYITDSQPNKTIPNNIGGSNISFGGNKPPPEPKKPNPYMQIIPVAPSPNLSIVQNVISQNINIQNQSIPRQLLSLFQTFLLSQQIKDKQPQTYPRQWLQILKQCLHVSQQQRAKLIKQRLKIWKKYRQTTVQQQLQINNSMMSDLLRQIKNDNYKYQQRMQRLNNQVEQYSNRIEEIIETANNQTSLANLQLARNDYVSTQGRYISEINRLIRRAEDRINPREEVVVPVPSFFQ